MGQTLYCGQRTAPGLTTYRFSQKNSYTENSTSDFTAFNTWSTNYPPSPKIFFLSYTYFRGVLPFLKHTSSLYVSSLDVYPCFPSTTTYSDLFTYSCRCGSKHLRQSLIFVLLVTVTQIDSTFLIPSERPPPPETQPEITCLS